MKARYISFGSKYEGVYDLFYKIACNEQEYSVLMQKWWEWDEEYNHPETHPNADDWTKKLQETIGVDRVEHLEVQYI